MKAASAGSITIDSVYPWGRSFEEYQRMFALTDDDLKLRIISCADGPASFNCELTQRGGRVVSCDPLYQLDADEIRSRIDTTHDLLVQLAEQNSQRFVWDRIRSPQELGRVRTEAMSKFLKDYEAGRAQGRYVTASLPSLDFPDESFDLALCSHFLLLYSDEFSLNFHVESVLEMRRVAREVRVFPLLDMRGEVSAHLEPLLRRISQHGLQGAVETVPYEFQRDGNEMLTVR
jgi:hypothetical protein